jgi:hypothetical protein
MALSGIKTDRAERIRGENFDLFRLTNSKATVDICDKTLRKYHEEGLPFYRRGKAVFVSKTELAAFIRGSFIPVTFHPRT